MADNNVRSEDGCDGTKAPFSRMRAALDSIPVHHAILFPSLTSVLGNRLAPLYFLHTDGCVNQGGFSERQIAEQLQVFRNAVQYYSGRTSSKGLKAGWEQSREATRTEPVVLASEANKM